MKPCPPSDGSPEGDFLVCGRGWPFSVTHGNGMNLLIPKAERTALFILYHSIPPCAMKWRKAGILKGHCPFGGGTGGKWVRSAHLREAQNDPQVGSETSRWHGSAFCDD